MNTPIKSLLVVFTAALFTTNTIVAQEMYVSASTNTKPGKEHSINPGDNVSLLNTEGITPESIATSNAKLMNRFESLFPGATKQQWTTGNNSFYVTFFHNGRKARACFTQKEALSYAIMECNLEQLPAALAKAIKTNYQDYTLFNAIEVNAHETIAHQVVLESATGFVTIKSTEEGIEEIQQVTKAPVTDR